MEDNQTDVIPVKQSFKHSKLVNNISVARDDEEEPTLKRIPVIILSGSSAEKDIHKIYGMHANCFTPLKKKSNNKLYLFFIIRKYNQSGNTETSFINRVNFLGKSISNIFLSKSFTIAVAA